MSAITTYFAAPDDEAAAAVGEQPLGPQSVGLPFVDANGIEPFVLLGQLAAELTGRTYDEIDAADRHGHAVAVIDHGDRIVSTVLDELRDALAGATRERLRAAAVVWADAEEFWGAADPDDLAAFLGRLAALAGTARANGDRLYCWVCV